MLISATGVDFAASAAAAGFPASASGTTSTFRSSSESVFGAFLSVDSDLELLSFAPMRGALDIAPANPDVLWTAAAPAARRLAEWRSRARVDIACDQKIDRSVLRKQTNNRVQAERRALFSRTDTRCIHECDATRAQRGNLGFK